MTETANQASYLTQGAYDRLKSELEELTGPGRTEIAKKIEAAREEGDLKENGGYHAAREEQGQQEARIRQLQELLRTAQVGVAPTASDTASPGMVLTIHYDDDPNDVEQLLLGSREEGAHGDLQVIGPRGRGEFDGESGHHLTGRGVAVLARLVRHLRADGDLDGGARWDVLDVLGGHADGLAGGGLHPAQRPLGLVPGLLGVLLVRPGPDQLADDLAGRLGGRGHRSGQDRGERDRGGDGGGLHRPGGQPHPRRPG